MLFKLKLLELKDIDFQHEMLLTLINRLYENAHKENAIDCFDEVITKLDYYANSHFAYEEGGMEYCHFPEINEHIKEHCYFIEKLSELKKLKAALNGEQGFLYTESLLFLKDWFLKHIAESDLKYSIHLKTFLKTA